MKPMDPQREAWILRFGLSYVQPSHNLPDALLAQLCKCRSDEARRLILGISR